MFISFKTIHCKVFNFIYFVNLIIIQIDPILLIILEKSPKAAALGSGQWALFAAKLANHATDSGYLN